MQKNICFQNSIPVYLWMHVTPVKTTIPEIVLVRVQKLFYFFFEILGNFYQMFALISFCKHNFLNLDFRHNKDSRNNHDSRHNNENRHHNNDNRHHNNDSRNNYDNRPRRPDSRSNRDFNRSQPPRRGYDRSDERNSQIFEFEID